MNISDYKFNDKTNKYVCPECGKEYSKNGIGTHIWRNHTEEGKQFNPNKGFKDRTRIAWNKGLTEETDERVRKYVKTLRKRFKNKEIIPSFLGKEHSVETKKKISESRRKFLLENPEKVPYKLNHSSKQSFPEKFFETLFINNGLIFEKEYHVSTYWLDFCFNKTFYVEIDGE